MIKKILFFLAVTGWALGVTVHLLSLADVDVARKAPYVWLLHMGIFVVWIPAVFELRKDKEIQAYQQSNGANRGSSLKIIFRNTPAWLRTIAIGGFIYALINFLLFAISQQGSPDIRDEQYFLQSHGHFIRNLTEQEYQHYKANEVRGFSGHWIAFYGIAAAALFPFNRKMES